MLTRLLTCAAVLGGAAIGLGAPSASAQVSTFDCAISSLEGRGFIRERIFFTIDTASNRAAVLDDLTNAVYDGPAQGSLQQLNNGQYRVKWEVENLKSGSNSFDIAYTLQYRPGAQALTLRANVSGFDNRPSGSGTCKPVAGRSLLP
ncbi:MAG: hypothetical protein AAFQ19_06225 [Pseudomonadota bacterium]